MHTHMCNNILLDAHVYMFMCYLLLYVGDIQLLEGYIGPVRVTYIKLSPILPQLLTGIQHIETAEKHESACMQAVSVAEVDLSPEHSREVVMFTSDGLLPFRELHKPRLHSRHLLLYGLETCE